ncbi:MAG: methylglyoxal synthase, partial [Lutibacter sp.]|nr:methylglyoxal synthase [Lutibacter sp.]
MEIAVIAHDGKKAEMIQFLMDFKAQILAKDIQFIAT